MLAWVFVITGVMFGSLLAYIATGVLADLAADAEWRPIDRACRPVTDITTALSAELIARADRLGL